MKNLTWQNLELLGFAACHKQELFVAQELINKVKSKCCGIKDIETMLGIEFAHIDSKWMLLDKTGKVVKNFGCIDAYTLLSVLVVNNDGLYGLINLDGEFIQQCEYLSITQPFCNRGNKNEKHDVLLLQDQKYKYWLSDKNGNIVTSRGYSKIGINYPHYYHFSNESYNGMIDLYDRIHPLSLTKTESYHGLFDMVNIHEVVPAIYFPGPPDSIPFDGIYADGIPVHDKSNGIMRCKMVDSKGNDLIPFEEGYTDIGKVPWSVDGYLIYAQKNNKYGYINIDGVVKIPFKYDVAKEFQSGFAIVGYGDPNQCYGDGFLYGVIDQHDRLVIPVMFSCILRVHIIDDKVFVYAQLPNTRNEFFIYGENKKVCKVAENVSLQEGHNENLTCIDGEIRKK